MNKPMRFGMFAWNETQMLTVWTLRRNKSGGTAGQCWWKFNVKGKG